MHHTDIELPRYRDWSPTAMDPRGLSLDDYQEWYVLPFMVTRDTPEHSIAMVNFDSACSELEYVDPDCADYHFAEFGHWGPGWFRIILVRPESKAAEEGMKMACAVADYPLLDDEELSKRECELVYNEWEDVSQYDRARWLYGFGIVVSAKELRSDRLPDGVWWEVYEDGSITLHQG